MSAQNDVWLLQLNLFLFQQVTGLEGCVDAGHLFHGLQREK